MINFYSRVTIFLSTLCLGVFVLPFYVPFHTKTASASYDHHFNNRVSVVSLWACLLLFILLFYKPLKAKISSIAIDEWIKPDSSTWLGKKHVYIAIAFYSLISYLLYILNANYGYGEEAYFLYRIDQLELNRVPYRDFEYAYGALFIYLPYFINRILGAASSIPGYYISLILLNTLGLYLLFRLINSFNIPKRRKWIIFYSIVLCFVPYQNGLNCSVFRYITPIASVFLIIKYHDAASPNNLVKGLYFALMASALVLLNFFISIEMGSGIFLSVIACLVFTGYVKKQGTYFLTLFFILLFSAGFYFLMGTDFFLTMKSFTSGAMNWVVVPSPSICFYICSFILVNFILSVKLLEQKNPAFACLLAFNLLMLAPAFGRCDPVHILDNGLGVVICAWTILAYLSDRYFKWYSILFFFVFVVAMNFSSLLTYKESIGIAAMKKFGENPATVKLVTRAALFLDKNKARKISGFIQKQQSRVDTAVMGQYSKIALPFYVDREIYLYLLKRGNYSPEFYTDVLNVGTEKQVNDKLRTLQDENHVYMVIPEKYFDLNRLYVKSEKEERKFISSLFLFPFFYKKTDDSRVMFEPIYNYIIDNYKVVDTVKRGYILVKRGK